MIAKIKSLSRHLIALILVIYSAKLPVQNQNVRFKHLDIEHGLYWNRIRDILQDKNQFMWIATWEGLNRYDGFAERRNSDKKILGWDSGKDLLSGISNLGSEQIIEELVKAGDEWGGDRQQDDDITFVVFKVV
jgi:ligand-binding sensor domain-containing protein